VRIDQLHKNFEIQIRWTAFPLHPETPEGGFPLERLYADRGVDLAKARARLKQVADDLGLPLGERTMTYNSRMAQEMAKWAESRQRGDEFHNAVFRAYFVDAKNIAKVDELARLARGVGLPEEEAVTVLESRTFKTAVDADWERSQAMGITAVPTFVVNHDAVVGAQPYEILEKLLLAHHLKRRRQL